MDKMLHHAQHNYKNEEREKLVSRYNRLTKKYDERYFYEYTETVERKIRKDFSLKVVGKIRAIKTKKEVVKKKFFKTITDIPERVTLHQVKLWLAQSKRDILIELELK